MRNQFTEDCVQLLSAQFRWWRCRDGATYQRQSQRRQGRFGVYVDADCRQDVSRAPEKRGHGPEIACCSSRTSLVVQVGATVEFLNSDKVAHNIFWPAISGNKKLSHNLGTWPIGQKREFKFDTPGVVPLLCNVHPEMSAYIVVSPDAVFRRNRRRRQLQDCRMCRTAATRCPRGTKA